MATLFILDVECFDVFELARVLGDDREHCEGARQRTQGKLPGLLQEVDQCPHVCAVAIFHFDQISV